MLILRQWYGCMRTRRWNSFLPALFTMYLFAAMRPASMASEEICSFSKLRKAFLEARGRRVVSDGWRGNTFRIEEPLNALFI